MASKSQEEEPRKVANAKGRVGCRMQEEEEEEEAWAIPKHIFRDWMFHLL